MGARNKIAKCFIYCVVRKGKELILVGQTRTSFVSHPLDQKKKDIKKACIEYKKLLGDVSFQSADKAKMLQ